MNQLLFILIPFVTLLNINYTPNPSVYILPIKNSIKMGSLSGNVNLTLGVKNILEEALMDKEYNLSNNKESSDYTLQTELIYFDIMQTSKNIAVFSTTPGAKYSIQIIPFGSEIPVIKEGFTANNIESSRIFDLSNLPKKDYDLIFIDISGNEVKYPIIIK